MKEKEVNGNSRCLLALVELFELHRAGIKNQREELRFLEVRVSELEEKIKKGGVL
jgi:hypothetical protein